MKLRKILALGLAACMMIGVLAGCGGSSDGGDAPAPAESEAAAPAADGAETEAAGGDAAAPLYEQAAGQTYVVGTDTTFAPFEFEDDNGEFTGIDIRLLEAIADEMGFTVEWQILGFSASVAALEAEQVDAVMAGMSITEERMQKYDFSDSYYDANIGVAVSADSDITDLEGLRGATVVVKNGTTSMQYAELIAPDYDMNLLYVDESSVMYQYVESGQAAACFDDYPIMQYEIARGNISLQIISQTEGEFVYPTALAVLKGNYPELVAAFNEGLARLQADGTYDAILADYFG
ncbi:MAG: transporter substrate-binding domain-containing protein [Lachnospiraceae bacterium]|nr:transporter substrate-binding domain-containing protein [Lachnospiraceae bacterium]MBQ9463945.1 transporter substrate-binding domain-containing protein [Lachnospiraceae bacterium]MBR0106145.1 transporter substrate-binding domain-containing protein [Lachnospiraceae bacterium]